MALTYVTRDGSRLTPWMLREINRLDADLYRLFKVHVKVTSGIRTYEEQKKIFLERYVTAANIRGRKVYDTRTWNGVKYYRISSAGTVAVPGYSNHEVQGTKAAVDIRDTGADAGITVRSSKRGKWIRANASKYSMIASGDGFGEGWHFDMIGINRDPNTGSSTGGGTVWDVAKKQRFLDQIGYSTGAPGWGPNCEAATKDFQGKVGLTVDGDFGPNTIKVAQTIINGGKFVSRSTLEIQKKFASFGFPVGPLDNDWGIKANFCTYLAQKKFGLTRDAQYGSATDAKCFPPAPKPDPPKPVPGRNATSRPIGDIQKFLKVPVTNKWDQATADATKAFQKSKFIDEDYVWGVTCDGFAFPPANIHAFGVDYSFARPSPDLLSMRSVRFAARYLWRTVQSDGKTNKGLSKAEYDSLQAKGIQVAFIYEEDGKELTLGYDAGVRVAKAAETYRNEQKLPVKPIYFNVDFNATDSAQLAKIWEALRGIASVIGIERVGLYAGYSVIKAAFDQKLITFGMQTYAWSNGQWDSRAQLRQWSNNQWGGSVDFQYAMAAEYGQTVIQPPTPDPDPEPNPDPDKILVDREHLETVRENLKLVLAQVESLLD